MNEPINPQENQPVVDENHVIAERREKLKAIREVAKANNSTVGWSKARSPTFTANTMFVGLRHTKIMALRQPTTT